jgi:hypothetical protein
MNAGYSATIWMRMLSHLDYSLGSGGESGNGPRGKLIANIINVGCLKCCRPDSLGESASVRDRNRSDRFRWPLSNHSVCTRAHLG